MPAKLFKPKLPDHAVDRFEFRWYTVDIDRNDSVVEHRAVYHVNTPWADLYPNEPKGADFVDHWQIFENDWFSGRTDEGFHAPWKDFHFQEVVFDTRAVARSAAIDRCQYRIANLRQRIDELTEKASALRREHNDEVNDTKGKAYY